MPARKKSETCRAVSVSMSPTDEKVVKFVCDHEKIQVSERVRQFFSARMKEILSEKSNETV